MLDTQEYPRLEERLLLRTFFGGQSLPGRVSSGQGGPAGKLAVVLCAVCCHEGTRRPAARQPRNAGCPASGRGAPLLARVPLRPAGAGPARLSALPAARAGDPAAPAPDLGGGLPEDLAPRRLAAPRLQPGAGGEGPGAAGRCRPGGAGDA